jgi:OmpA-OmpF porin, OOP family
MTRSQRQLKTLSQVLLSTLFVSASASALAQAPAPKPGSAYWRDSQGQVIRDGFGGCVVSGFYTPDLATDECASPKAKPAMTPAAPKASAASAASSLPAGPKIPEVTPAPQQVTYKASSFFDFDKTVVKPAGRQALQAMMNQAKGADIEQIRVEGHTDATGPTDYNQGLSERRADAVKRVLVELGAPPSKIMTEGFGETQPIADNKTREGRAQNRRVVVEFLGSRIKR